MTVDIRNGFLVAVSASGKIADRLALVLKAQPKGKIVRNGALYFEGRRYAKAYHFKPGIMQGRAVAWPEDL